MRNISLKRYSVLFVVVIYFLSTFLQSFSFLNFNKVYAAENKINYTNLVTIFVDNKIYNSIQSDIERYAKKYIQWSDSDTRYNAISNSKAIILPIDIENITAPEISKILENMYFDGISWEPSKLIWVILVWDIPLPVVNQDGFIYPTIYPYVDFEEQKFIWNDDLKYFVYNDNPQWQAEVWHGLINFDNIVDYKNYFDKLKNYANNPEEFVDKAIWYDDMIANKKYFFEDALLPYINNFLFAEDIGYKRFNDLMLKVMQGTYNDSLSEILAWIWWSDTEGRLNNIAESSDTPTLSVEQMIRWGFLESYISLLWTKHLNNVVKNVETANRRIEDYKLSDGSAGTRTALDTHYDKIEQKDEGLLRLEWWIDPVMIIFNQALENIVNEKIEKEKYWLNEVIPLTYLKYEWYEKWTKCTWKVYDAFENYFFGLNAEYITNMQQISTYRWTFWNFDNIVGLTNSGMQNNQLKSWFLNTIDINKKSVWASYDIFATQVDANRWYNINSTMQELDKYEENKIPKRENRNTKCEQERLGICWKKRKREPSNKQEDLCDINDDEKQWWCEDLYEFSRRSWWWASPLNLDASNGYFWKSGYNFQDAILPIFNIAWSRMITEAQFNANSFKGVKDYSRLIQKTFVPSEKPKYYTKNKNEENPDLFGLWYNPSMGEDMKFTNWLPTENLEEPTWVYVNPKQYSSVDFFSKFNNRETEWQNDIIKITKHNDGECIWSGEIYTYKTLDSRVINNMSLNTDISSRMYKVFEDKESPSLMFYNPLENRLNLMYTDVWNIIYDLQWIGNLWWARTNINTLKSHVNSIKSKINNIIALSTWTIASMNSSQIQSTANERKQAFTENDYTKAQKLSSQIKNQLVELFLMANEFEFDELTDYVKTKIEQSVLMDEKLYLLNTQKDSLIAKSNSIKNKINNIPNLITDTKNDYDGIDQLSNNLLSSLTSKYNSIKALNNGSGCNSSSHYYKLCQAINTVKENLNNKRDSFNEEIEGIQEKLEYDEDFLSGLWNFWDNILGTEESIFEQISTVNSFEVTASLYDFKNTIDKITTSNNSNLTGVINGINFATSDKPIDSPKYITFKWIGWDEVIFIYPNLYKAEIFSGNNILKLKDPSEISQAIKTYLREVVKKYNNDLKTQKQKRSSYFNLNSSAFTKLWQKDKLANPTIINDENRPYNLISENFLIDELNKKLKNNAFFYSQMWTGNNIDPIDFIAQLIYYQNLGWSQRTLWNTIAEDINNTISDFDINEKILHITQNYLVKDNNQGQFLTPTYRDNWYEVAFINSDGEDYINTKATAPIAQHIQSTVQNFQRPEMPTEAVSSLADELLNDCNIPEAEWVLLFDINNIIAGNWNEVSPWANALQCRWEKTKQLSLKDVVTVDWSNAQWPVFKWWEGASFEELLKGNAWINEVISYYEEQIPFLNTDESNDNTLNQTNSVDYQQLEKILSYTQIKSSTQNINADDAKTTISIHSNNELGKVQFYIHSIWNNKVILKDGSQILSNNITQWQENYKTGSLIFDPFEKKELQVEIQENPIASNDLLVFYMCTPGTNDLNQCVKKSQKINIIPGAIADIKIITPWNRAIQWSSFPIAVQWTDQFGNNVWQLFTEKFKISVSTWTLSHQSNIAKEIVFSNFDKSYFMLNVDKNIANNSEIRINVDGNIWWNFWTYASKDIVIKQGTIKVLQWNNTLVNFKLNLPKTNEYSYKDNFGLGQINVNTIPKIEIELRDSENDLLGIESYVSVTSKNSLLKIWELKTKKVQKQQNNTTVEVAQTQFASKNNFITNNGKLTIYLMPTFKAGNDEIIISIAGLETKIIEAEISPAPASIVEISTEKTQISKNGKVKAQLQIFDNWDNLIKKDTEIIVWVTTPLSISGLNTHSATMNIHNGSWNFEITSTDKGGNGFVYAQLKEVEEQRPDSKSILVQESFLPEKWLNIMYLNLFGSDWWNQWWFMSNNKKYIQNLINNSEKLITTTTQLVSPENLKQFYITISKKLEIQNNNINTELLLNNDLIFDIEWIWKMGAGMIPTEMKQVNIDNNIEKTVENILAHKVLGKNILVYIPEKIDSIIEKNEVKNNTIYINNEKAFDLSTKQQSSNLKIVLNDTTILWQQIWNVRWDNTIVWKIILIIDKTSDITFHTISTNPGYEIQTIWIDGSTNKEWIGFYDINSRFNNSSLWYNSIQNSNDPTLGLGFTDNFKNITEFGAGKPVWEATTRYSSEFLINIWDPLLKRVSNNINSKIYNPKDDTTKDSGFDRWIGEVVFSEPNKNILKVINVDFNNDWLEDMIIAFNDGTIKLLKNYWWNTPFKDMWDLMVLADGIKEIIIWDVDGNGYKDIIIRNNSDILRVYKNSFWVFDVDGLPICINTNVKENEISETPHKVYDVSQIFFEDMNNDGILDIVTNDKLWYIKIFYGWTNNGQNYYVSNNKYTCDDDWYQRQSSNTKSIHRFGVRVNENIKVLDQSLIRWQWINPNQEININMDSLWVDTSKFSDESLSTITYKDGKKTKINESRLEEMLDNSLNFDTTEAIQMYKDIERYKIANFNIIPSYEDDIEDTNEIEYVAIGCLTGSDPVKIYKKYEDINGDVLENGDKVEVTVSINATQNFKWTFIDNIVGPRIIPLSWDMNMIENFWFTTWSISSEKVENELIFHWDMDNARYMIDNLSLNSGDTVEINYWLYYDGDISTNQIEIIDVDGDKYSKFGGEDGETLENRQKDGLKDIKVQPIDGCNKSLFVLFNNNQWDKKSYASEYIDLAKSLANISNQWQNAFDDSINEFQDALISNAISGNSDLSEVPGIWKEIRGNLADSINVWSDVFNREALSNLWWWSFADAISMSMEMMNGMSDKISSKIDSVLGSLCNGFKLSSLWIGGEWNCGLPIPFNQALLAPGDYHLFGCLKKPLLPLTNTIGKGIPALTIPGNWPSPWGYLPIPWIFGLPVKWASDGFLWIPWGTNDSLFRLYLVPTITAEIAVAMCFGPHGVGINIPSPLAEIQGNCFITSVALPCKEEKNNSIQETQEIPEEILDINSCSIENVPCFTSAGEASTSLELVSSNNVSSNMTTAIPDGSFAGWLINIEKKPITAEWYRNNSLNLNNAVELFGWADSENKIRGWDGGGWCIKKIVKEFLEKQTAYILNNLTNFKLSIVWPDFEDMISGIPDLFSKEWKICGDDDCWNKLKLECESDDTKIWNSDKKECELTEKQKCLNKWKKRVESTKTCEKKPKSNNENDSFMQNVYKENLLNRSQITNMDETLWINNPFLALEKMFEDVELINIRTENITVKIPMLTSDDISAYISMMQNWIKQQNATIEKRKKLLWWLLWICGWDTDNINSFEDLKQAFKSLKKQLEEELQKELKGLENQIKDLEKKISNTEDEAEKEKLEEEKKKLGEEKTALNNDISMINDQITQIKKISSKYNTEDLGDIEIFQSCKLWEYYIRVNSDTNPGAIIPYDVYILYKPWASNEMSMFTQWLDLITEKQKKKTKLYIKENWKTISNEWLCIKNNKLSRPNQCADLVLWGKLDKILSDFLNIQSNTTLLINSIKQNINTLELYKKFPLEVYEWVHVWDRYISEISWLVDSLFGTLSLWMKTNATRYSQYVDSIILIKTTLETYQVIIDVSKNRSEKCSTCTVDSYDQYSCMLGLCPSNILQAIEIPPFKIPSIILDFSNINLWIDIKLPKFNFIPISVPLPKLPNIPNPPSIDLSLDMEQALSMGIDVLEELFAQIDVLNLWIALPAIPIIPAPPKLPELPSFIPNIKLELPLLPPAPKIPQIPNTISAAIGTIELVARILCIVKKWIWLVGESSLKAKIEQMTQRTYEIPYRDNMDQTFKNIINKDQKDKIPKWIEDSFAFLKNSAFSEATLQGFDIKLESYINIQFDFSTVYDFINSLVNLINKYSSWPIDAMQEEIIDPINNQSNETEKRMSICVSDPVSKECLWDLYTWKIVEYKNKYDKLKLQLTTIGINIKSGFSDTKEAMLQIEKLKNKIETLETEIEKLQTIIDETKETLETLEWDLALSSNEERIDRLERNIADQNLLLKQSIEKINKLQVELSNTNQILKKLEEEYWPAIKIYEEYLADYNELEEEHNEIRAKIDEFIWTGLSLINSGIGWLNTWTDYLFNDINEWNLYIESQIQQREKIEESNKEQRRDNLQQLYNKELDNISYVDYDPETYANSVNNIKDALKTLISKSDDKSTIREIEGHLTNITQDNKISPADNSLKDVEKQYLAIAEFIYEDNKTVKDLISNDYNKFLYSIAENKQTLVNNDQIELSLSSNLFEMNPVSLERLKWLNFDLQIENESKTNVQNNQTKVNIESNINNQKVESSISNTINYSDITNSKLLIAQNNWNNTNTNSNNNWDFVELGDYIDVIKTSEWNINLANIDYTKQFQNNNLATDINGDGKVDLILWDKQNVYIKYKDGEKKYPNTTYNKKLYKYNINSYQQLMENSDNGFVKINDVYIKLCDYNWEIKNFKYMGWDFDNIRISRSNSSILGDQVWWYLVKMIHRVDLFDDKEKIVNNNNQSFFDKKYILLLPKNSDISKTRIELEEWVFNIESIIDTMIFDIKYYNPAQTKIDLSIEELPRNWQYSQIYTLNLKWNELYYISSPSSNQIVGGPQIVGNTEWPSSTINLFRPSIQSIVDEWEQLDVYVSTNYTLQSKWIDNIGLKKIWITDSEGNILKEKDDLNTQTWYIELNNLYFTGVGTENYYFVGENVDGNNSSTQVTLKIKKPDIEIVDIVQHGTQSNQDIAPATIIAEISHDVDEAYVQFLRNRHGIRETMTWNMWGIQVDKYQLNPLQTIVTWWYYDFGNEIGLFMSNGDLAVKINPINWKITIENNYENIIKVELDYTNKVPIVKVMEDEQILFGISFAAKELVKINTNLKQVELTWDNFDQFNGGTAIIKDNKSLLYISPKWKIYAEEVLYWNYFFNINNDSIIYSFRTQKNWADLWTIEMKIKNMLLD